MMEVVGHRGAAGEAPENTIAGCLHAYQRGARHLEIDLRHVEFSEEAYSNALA